MESFALVSDGVARLRELVLELAMRGRLTDQRPEESAAGLRITIAAAKQSLIEAKERRRLEPFKPVSVDEMPYSLPDNWEWVRIGDAMTLDNGRAFKKSEWTSNGLPIIRIQNLNDHNAAFNYCDGVIDEKFHVRDGDFLISWSGTPGTSFGAFVWQRGHALLNQHIYRCELVGDVFHDEFLRLAVNSRLEEMIANAHGGVGLRHITKGKLRDVCIPLAPEPEQRRIVAKVDELMSLCDELESQRTQRVTLRQQASRSSLHHLVNASSRDDLATAWQRLSDHFEVLYDVPETIDDLRQSILQLAVQGKLVRQDPNDGSGAELRKKIEEQRDRLWSKYSIRNYPHVVPVSQHEVPFNVPRSWEWIRLGDVGIFFGGGTPSKRNPEYWNGDIPWVSPKDMKRSFIDDAMDHVSSAGVENSSAKMIPTGSLLMVIRGMILLHSFPVAISTRELTINQDMKAITMAIPEMGRFMLKVCGGSKGRMLTLVERSSHGTCRLPTEEVANFPIPLPPIAEQRRIVAKVDEMLSQCDELWNKMSERQTTRIELLAATIHQLLDAS